MQDYVSMLDRGNIPDSHVQIYRVFEREQVVELFRVFRLFPEQDLRMNAIRKGHIFLMNFITPHLVLAGVEGHPSEPDMHSTLVVAPPAPLLQLAPSICPGLMSDFKGLT